MSKDRNRCQVCGNHATRGEYHHVKGFHIDGEFLKVCRHCIEPLINQPDYIQNIIDSLDPNVKQKNREEKLKQLLDE